MDFNERVIPGVSANFLYREALARYEFAGEVLRQRKRQCILDLACGTGYGSSFLAESNTVVGIDRDREAIAFAKKHYGANIKFIVGDIEKSLASQGLTSQGYDAVCAFEIIEHLNKPIIFLKNVCSVLKPHSIFILSTPNAYISSPDGKLKSKYHVKEFTKSELEKLLHKHFRKVELYGQRKSRRAKKALESFMESQSVRQTFVDNDKFGIRKLFPKKIKEKVWKILGGFYGRTKQDFLETKDFPITKKDVEKAEYFVAVCRK